MKVMKQKRKPAKLVLAYLWDHLTPSSSLSPTGTLVIALIEFLSMSSHRTDVLDPLFRS